MVNAKSPRAQAGVEFLRWLTDEPQQRFLLDTTHNIPANRLASTGLSGPLAQFADDMDAVVHPRLCAVQERPTVVEAFNKGIQSIIIGEETSLQVATGVQQIKQREESRLSALPSSTKPTARASAEMGSTHATR